MLSGQKIELGGANNRNTHSCADFYTKPTFELSKLCADPLPNNMQNSAWEPVLFVREQRIQPLLHLTQFFSPQRLQLSFG